MPFGGGGGGGGVPDGGGGVGSTGSGGGTRPETCTQTSCQYKEYIFPWWQLLHSWQNCFHSQHKADEDVDNAAEVKACMTYALKKPKQYFIIGEVAAVPKEIRKGYSSLLATLQRMFGCQTWICIWDHGSLGLSGSGALM